MHTVIQEHYQWNQTLDLDGYRGIVRFDGGHRGGGRKDWRHGMWGPPHHEFIAEREDGEHGRGFVFQVSRNEFYIVGAAFRLLLRAVLPPDRMRGVSKSGYHERYISIDEGHFDDDGNYVIDRRRNGDEIAFGIWVEADTGVVRAILCD